jgi:hypothetical protein
MDKPKILIKINGKERSFSETTTDEQIKKEPNFQTEVKQELKNNHPTSPIHKDYELAEEEIAAAKEEREFEWILPQSHQLEDDPYDKLVKRDPVKKKSKPIIGTFSFPSIQKKRNKSTYPFKTLFLAIISALVIGTSFGMVVLHLFTKDLAQPAFEVTQSIDSEGTVGEAEPEAEPSNGIQEVPITLPAIEVFVVQGGMFSSAEAAAPIVDGLKGEGFAGALINHEDKYYLFMGIGISDLVSKTMANTYETAGKETYVKAFSIPEVMTEGDPSMVTAEKLFNHLILYSSNKFTSMPESVNWDEIKTTYDELAAKGTDSSFVNTVMESYKAVEAYHGSSSNADFWSSQQALLTSLQEYQKWFFEQRN